MATSQKRRCVGTALLAVMVWSVTGDAWGQEIQATFPLNTSSELTVISIPSVTTEPLQPASLKISIAKASAQSGVLHRPQKSCGKKVLLGLGIGTGVGFALGSAEGFGDPDGVRTGVAAIVLGSLIGLAIGLNSCR